MLFELRPLTLRQRLTMLPRVWLGQYRILARRGSSTEAGVAAFWLAWVFLRAAL